MKIDGLLCRSAASVAVCVPGDPRTMIVRRQDRTTSRANTERSRLLEPKRSFLAGRSDRSVTLPMVLKQEKSAPAPPKATRVVTAAPVLALPAPGDDRGLQVVVMRVSIHCEGCAGKVRKHISKMEGVTSFSIDLDSKKVTVMGHVSPEWVLESISKVKKAEFWPSS